MVPYHPAIVKRKTKIPRLFGRFLFSVRLEPTTTAAKVASWRAIPHAILIAIKAI